MLMLSRMSKVSNRSAARQTNATAQTSLTRTLLSIAALSVNVATDPHIGRNNRADLEILQQAVRLTKPWIEAVLEDIVQHFPFLADHDYQPTAKRPKSLQDKSRLGALLSLLSTFWKVSRLVKSGNGVPRQARVLKRLHSALSAELASAEREIERLKALLEGKKCRRRRRKGDERIGSEDEWEDVGAAAEGGEEGVREGEDTVVVEDTVEDNGEVAAHAQADDTEQVSQKSSEGSKKSLSKSPPGSKTSKKSASRDASVQMDSAAATEQQDEPAQPRPSSKASSYNSKAAKSSKIPTGSKVPSKDTSRAASPLVEGLATVEQQDGPAQPRPSSKASGHDGTAAEADRAAGHVSPDKAGTPSKMRGDSKASKADSKVSQINSKRKLEDTGKSTSKSTKRVVKEPGKSSSRSSKKSSSSQSAKANGVWSPATSRSSTTSTQSKRSVVVEKAASSKADSLSPKRGRRTSPKELNPSNCGVETVADREVPVEAQVAAADESRGGSHRSSRAASEVATVLVPDDAAAIVHEAGGVELGHDDTKQTQSKSTGKASSKVSSRSKKSSSGLTRNAVLDDRHENVKPATSPSSHRSGKSTKPQGTHQESREASASKVSPAKTMSKCRSISADGSRQPGSEAEASPKRSPSSSSTNSSHSNHHAEATSTYDCGDQAAKRSESVASIRSGCHCQRFSRPRKCHHTGSLASSGCDSKAWSCEVSLDAQGVLQLKAEHFHRRPDGC